MKILKAYGIPPNLLRATEAMYTDMRSVVVTPDGETGEFDILAGVLQKDTLATYLFTIVLGFALWKATEGMEEELGSTITPNRSRWIAPVIITDINFADDMCMLSNKKVQAQLWDRSR